MRLALALGKWTKESFLGTMLSNGPNTLTTAGSIHFSRGQRLILSMLCRGLSPKEIAAALGIAEGTAHTHIRNLYGKAGVSGDRQLILYVMQQPHAMHPGRECHRGLHSSAPGCSCPHCLAMLLAA